LIEYSIDYSELKRIEDAYARAPQIVQEALAAAITEADLFVWRQLVDSDAMTKAKASGLLRQSLFHEEKIDGANVTGLVATAIDYAVPVELGTRPHFPPVEPLIDWVKTKFHVKGEKEARGLAFVIARKISQRGTPAKYPFRDTFVEAQPEVFAIFDRAVARISERLAKP
jgi:hypothetical protein